MQILNKTSPTPINVKLMNNISYYFSLDLRIQLLDIQNLHRAKYTKFLENNELIQRSIENNINNKLVNNFYLVVQEDF